MTGTFGKYSPCMLSDFYFITFSSVPSSSSFFFFFWLCWVFVAAHRLSLVAVSGGYSLLQYVGFSLWWLLLQRMGSRRAGFRSCGTRAQ